MKIILILIFLSLGFALAGIFTSVAICAGNHISLLVPGVVCLYLAFKRDGMKALPPSSWALLLLVFIGVVSCAHNWKTMDDPVNGVLKLRYFLFGVFGVAAFRYALKAKGTMGATRILINIFLISIIISTLYGLVATFLDFDLLTWRERHMERVGGFTLSIRLAAGLSLVLPVILTIWLRRTNSKIG